MLSDLAVPLIAISLILLLIGGYRSIKRRKKNDKKKGELID